MTKFSILISAIALLAAPAWAGVNFPKASDGEIECWQNGEKIFNFDFDDKQVIPTSGEKMIIVSKSEKKEDERFEQDVAHKIIVSPNSSTTCLISWD